MFHYAGFHLHIQTNDKYLLMEKSDVILLVKFYWAKMITSGNLRLIYFFISFLKLEYNWQEMPKKWCFFSLEFCAIYSSFRIFYSNQIIIRLKLLKLRNGLHTDGNNPYNLSCSLVQSEFSASAKGNYFFFQ